MDIKYQLLVNNSGDSSPKINSNIPQTINITVNDILNASRNFSLYNININMVVTVITTLFRHTLNVWYDVKISPNKMLVISSNEPIISIVLFI